MQEFTRINTIANILETHTVPKGKRFRLTVTDLDTGQVMYDWHSLGGVLVNVEKAEFIRDEGAVDGQQQILLFGNPLVAAHANLMLRRHIDQNAKRLRDDLLYGLNHALSRPDFKF